MKIFFLTVLMSAAFFDVSAQTSKSSNTPDLAVIGQKQCKENSPR